MDLIQMYHDQGSQSSSSCEEPTFVEPTEDAIGIETAPRPKISQRQMRQQYSQPPPPPPPPPEPQHNGTNGRQLNANELQKIQPANFAQWRTDIDKRVHLCLGTLDVLQKNTILESMDYFISKLTKDYNKLILPKIAENLASYIRTYLYVYRYLYRSFEMGKRYFKRIVQILAIYTDMELCASIRGTEYDTTIAERIQFIYQTYLQVNDPNMILDVLLNMKRLWRRHRGILNLLLQHFLILSEPVEFVDLLFIKNLIVFKRWLYIEEVTEDRDKIREAFVKFVKPKRTICMNSLFKPYLPVDEEGFVRIENMSSVLDSGFPIGQLTRALRKAEEFAESQPQAKEILIVLTDDEDEAPTNNFTQLNSDSHHSHIDDLSIDFDGQSSISTQSTHTSNDIMMIDTLSIDTLPSHLSGMSRHSIDLVTDNTTSLSECVNTVEDSSDNSESATTLCVPSDVMSLNSSNDYANDVPTVDAIGDDTIAVLCHEMDAGRCVALEIPPLDQSTFNNLVNNINETQISESFANIASNNSASNIESISVCDALVGTPPSPVVTRHEMSCQTTISLPVHSDSQQLDEVPRTPTEVAALLSTDGGATGPVNGVVVAAIVSDQVLVETWTSEKCDTVNKSISNASLGNHHETLQTIDEIVSADQNEHTEDSSPAVEETPAKEQTIAARDSSLPPQILVSVSVPAADGVPLETPIVNDSVTETVLLSQSEQELIFNDDQEEIAMEIFTPGNDSMAAEVASRLTPSPTLSIDDRPPIWMRNGINNPPKTYSKIRKEKADAGKLPPTKATPQLSVGQANVSTQPVDDEDSFLMDIFCSNEVRTRLQDSNSSRPETVYSSSTPNIGKPGPAANRRTPRVSRKVNKAPKEIVSPTKVPSPKKNVKRNDSMTARGGSKRQSKSPKAPKSPKKATPTRTKGLNKSRLDRLMAATPPTILTRQTYTKAPHHQPSSDFEDSFPDVCNEKLHHSGTFFMSSFGRRSNGKLGTSVTKNKSSTILERKTYIKAPASNVTPSSSSLQSQTFDSCSHNTSGSSTTNNNYSSNAAAASNVAYALKNDKTRFGSVVSNDSIELDYLNDIFSSDFDSSKGIRNPLPGLISSRNTDHQMTATGQLEKRHQMSSEFSDLDEMDDSYNTRKSKRRRKRPKKLDL